MSTKKKSGQKCRNMFFKVTKEVMSSTLVKVLTKLTVNGLVNHYTSCRIYGV